MHSIFPAAATADESGLVLTTADLTADMLLDAYHHGIFPWSDHPVRWYSPHPRAILLTRAVHLPRNLEKIARRAGFSVTLDQAFASVMQACAAEHAAHGNWISPRFVRAYSELNQRGYAHSVEVWQQGALVGGLYGVLLGHVFSGESMFYRVANASKVAVAALVQELFARHVPLIDAQVINAHTARLGARLVARADFLQLLRQLNGEALPPPAGPWHA